MNETESFLRKCKFFVELLDKKKKDTKKSLNKKET